MLQVKLAQIILILSHFTLGAKICAKILSRHLRGESNRHSYSKLTLEQILLASFTKRGLIPASTWLRACLGRFKTQLNERPLNVPKTEKVP